ncbi:MAG: response regulator transcription factor, partial [Leptolyngbyaceae cyanobacterium SL_7_1]|nr:response regulator transcription factor [Leptolyngbyaceae cyanobacterium SL_7_1]
MKILLVEDDLSSGKLLSKILKNHHYAIDLATDGLTGLELASQWSYDLYILDVQLPKLDGISLCHRLRAQGKTAPILMLTGKRSNDDIVTGLDAGADDYVIKPFDANRSWNDNRR